MTPNQTPTPDPTTDILRGLELLFGGLAKINPAMLPAVHCVGADVQRDDVSKFETIRVSCGKHTQVFKMPDSYSMKGWNANIPTPVNNLAGLRKLISGLNELLTSAVAVEADDVHESAKPTMPSQHPLASSGESVPAPIAQSEAASVPGQPAAGSQCEETRQLDTESQSQTQP